MNKDESVDFSQAAYLHFIDQIHVYNSCSLCGGFCSLLFADILYAPAPPSLLLSLPPLCLGPPVRVNSLSKPLFQKLVL